MQPKRGAWLAGLVARKTLACLAHEAHPIALLSAIPIRAYPARVSLSASKPQGEPAFCKAPLYEDGADYPTAGPSLVDTVVLGGIR